MTVYVVVCGDYDGDMVHAVFDSAEKAEARCVEKRPGSGFDWYVEEKEVE